MKKLFFLIIITAFALSAKAQAGGASVPVVVEGTVYDSLSLKPLPDAAVTLMRKGRAVTFARTDSDGRFNVTAEVGDRLQVTFLGYMKKSMPVEGRQTVDVPMAQKAFELKEIQVEGMPVFGRRDTVMFDLKRFAGERDNSLKDVLKKLPGVDVDESGRISFNGKDITRFTVEDLDLTGGRYNKLSEILKAKDVDKAEIVEHDQPVKALRDKVFTNDVAMNIRLRPEVRDKWMFTLRPAAVTDFTMRHTELQADADALQIGRKCQRMYTAGYDHSGRDLSENDALLALTGTAADGAGTCVPQWFAAPPLVSPVDAERVRFNRSCDFTVKQTRKTSSGGERRIAAGYTHTDESRTTGNTSLYYFDGENPVRTDETDRSRIRSDMIYVEFNHNTNTESVYGDEQFRLSGTRGDGLSVFAGDGDAGITQRVETPELNARNTFTRILTGDKLSWQLHSTLDFHYAPHRMTVDGLTQKMNNIIYYTDNYARLTLSRRSLTHRYNVGLTAEHLNLRGRRTRLTVHTVPDWQLTRSGLKLLLFVPVRWTVITGDGGQYLDASPTMLANIRSGTRGEWNVNAGYAMTTDGWESFAVGEYMSDYRTHVFNGSMPSRRGTFSVGVSYDYKRPVKEMFMSFGANYSRNHGNMMTDMAITGGHYLLNSVARCWHGQSATARALVSKGFFGIRMKTKFEAVYNYAAGMQLSSGIITGYCLHALTVKPEVVLSPAFGTFTYRGEFSLNKIRTGGMAQKALFGMVQRLSYTHTVGRVDIGTSVIHYHNRLQSGQVAGILLADAGVVWRLKKVRLSAEVRNIFDKRRYSITTYGGVAVSTSYYELRPREILVTAQVSM